MNLAEIAERFIRAAEIERASHDHVGPARLRAQQLPYVHTYADKAGWRKEPGDKLERGADPLAEERRAFWERMGIMPSAGEITELEGLHDLLMLVGTDGERRALLAWARSKVGGKAFRRWCFQVEGIHPETGRKRKDRALVQILKSLGSSDVQNCKMGSDDRLRVGADFEDISATVEEVAGEREGLNHWASDDAFTTFLTDGKHDFSWADKRNERRRRREAAKRKSEVA